MEAILIQVCAQSHLKHLRPVLKHKYPCSRTGLEEVEEVLYRKVENMGASRYLAEEAIYHVYCRGNNKVKVFHVGHDYSKYRSNILKYKKKYGFKIYFYLLMPNHLHLLIEPRLIGDLSKIMHSLNLSYTMWHNRRYDCVGHIWQSRYRSRIINSDTDLINCMAYIEMNQVNAGLAKGPELYKWSSCYERFKKIKDRILDFNPIYLELGADEQERRRIYYEIMLKTGSQAQVPVLKNRS